MPESNILEVLTIIGGTIAGTAALIGGAASFLWSRMSSIYQQMENNRKNVDDKFYTMSTKASQRHEENVYAMEQIRIALARAGLWNGHTPNNRKK